MTKLSRNTTDLNEEDAKIVARLYKIQPDTKAQNSSLNVETIYNSDNIPVIYVVNFGDSNGYLLISASKKYYPILIESEYGHFDVDDMDPCSKIFIDGYIDSISDAISSNDTSIINQYSSEWRRFENSLSDDYTPTKLSGIDDFVMSNINDWENSGYTVYPLGGCPPGLPEDVYQSYVISAQGLCDPNQNYQDVSFIIVQRETSSQIVNPLIQTSWHQGNPYNNSTPLYMGPEGISHSKVGCVALAVAQIMRYHQWPTYFDWTNIPTILSNSNAPTTLSDYLYTVGYKVHTTYGISESSSNDMYARHALINEFNYNCDNISAYNNGTVISSLYNSRPVYMSGDRYENGQRKGHAWVADGYRHYQLVETFSLQVLTPYEPYQFESPVEPYTNVDSSLQIHMVYGNAYGNQWCYYQNNSTDFVYKHNIKHICNIRPNN